MFDISKKIIFTHPPKCGGTSIEYALGALPKNYVEAHNTEIIRKGNSARCMSVIPNVPFKHESLDKHIKKLNELGEDRLNYFVFSCVRNPWDRAVSRYYHDITIAAERCKNMDITTQPYKRLWQLANTDFSSYIQIKFDQYNIDSRNNVVNIKNFLFYNDAYNIDFIIRFENLQKDFNVVSNKIFGVNKKLEHVHFHSNRPKIKYQDFYLNLNIKNMVEVMGKDTIELFNYTFD